MIHSTHMDNLKDKKCVPCEDKDFPPLTPAQAHEFMEHVPLWSITDDCAEIYRTFRFKNFKDALSFTNKVGMLAEAEQHHPDIALAWGKVEVRLSTHSIGGLSENDFIVAVKTDLIA